MNKLLIILSLALCSCSVSKRVTRSHASADSLSLVHSTLSNVTVETSTLTERAKDTVTVPAEVFVDEADTLDVFDTPTMTATLTIDPVTHRKRLTWKTKPKQVIVDIDRTIVTVKGGTIQATLDGTTQVAKVIDQYSKDVERKGGVNWTLIIGGLCAACFVIAGLKFGWFVGWRKKPDDEAGPNV